MKRIISVIVLFVLCATTFAGPAKKKEQKKYLPEEIEQIRAESKRLAYQRTGGEVIKPGIGKGEFVVYNVQKRIAESNLISVTRHLSSIFRVPVAIRNLTEMVTDKNASMLLSEKGGNVAVFLIDDATSPNSLIIQPEARWAIVNVSALTKDNPIEAFVAARLKKELVRGLLYAANAGNSQYPHSLMGVVCNMKQLDDIPRPNPPVDVVSRILKNMPEMGIERWEKYTYLDACEEGWAPAPTNDIQKAIWDKVHQLPTKPIKILPETKPVKE